MLQLTGTARFLGTYGSYTAFIPTNDGVKKFLTEQGKSTLEEVDLNLLKDLVKLHLIEDTITTSQFTDGKIPALTMYGQYLITGSSNIGGKTNITVNRQANIVTGNVVVGNGYVHVIDRMLQPAKLTLAQMIEANPNLSMFTQALKETGLFDSLNFKPADNPNTGKKYLTVLAESDLVLKAAGFPTYASLKSRYRTGDPKSVTDSLNLFVRYHIIPEAKYLADIIGLATHSTLAPLEVVNAKLEGQTVLINDIDFNGLHETGAALERNLSDNSAVNGVLHTITSYTYEPAVGAPQTATGHFAIKVRKSEPVYWDVCTNIPEFTKASFYRKRTSPSSGRYVKSSGDPLTNFFWPTDNDATAGPRYVFDGGAYRSDFIEIPLGPASGVGVTVPRNPYADLVTPLIVKGTYKVWLCYRYARQSTGSRLVIRGSVDGFDLSRNIWQPTEQRPVASGANWREDMEREGWKQYTAGADNRNYAGRMLGAIEFKTTATHKFTLTCLSGFQNNNNLDMIQFIPTTLTGLDQVYPLFRPDGTFESKP
jgi:hypothetical protein